MRDSIMHHQMHTLDSPSVITFSTERPRMLVSWSFIAQNAPTESCRCTTRIPWYHQNPAYTHRILFALTAWLWRLFHFRLYEYIAWVVHHMCRQTYNMRAISYRNRPTTVPDRHITSDVGLRQRVMLIECYVFIFCLWMLTHISFTWVSVESMAF